jgi:hypothetical protein
VRSQHVERGCYFDGAVVRVHAGGAAAGRTELCQVR